VLALTSADWYPIYTLCGRAISGIDPLTDQHLGGLILWIPASGINVIASMVALRNWMRLSERGRLPQPTRWAAGGKPTTPEPTPAG
jgi:putative membrane protein